MQGMNIAFGMLGLTDGLLHLVH